MPHYAPIHFGHERNSERLGGAQRVDDELLRMVAGCQSIERSDGDFSDSADVGARFTSDEYLVTHASDVPS